MTARLFLWPGEDARSQTAPTRRMSKAGHRHEMKTTVETQGDLYDAPMRFKRIKRSCKEGIAFATIEKKRRVQFNLDGLDMTKTVLKPDESSTWITAKGTALGVPISVPAARGAGRPRGPPLLVGYNRPSGRPRVFPRRGSAMGFIASICSALPTGLRPGTGDRRTADLHQHDF